MPLTLVFSTSCLFLLAPDPLDISESRLSQRFSRAIEMYEEGRDGLYLIVFWPVVILKIKFFYTSWPWHSSAFLKWQPRILHLKAPSVSLNVCLLVVVGRKMFWTDGSTINMANMDGSNIKILHQNQKDPVGKFSLFTLTINAGKNSL